MTRRSKPLPGTFSAPHFRAFATVDVFKEGSQSSCPDAQLRVSFYLFNRDDEHGSAKREAQWCLERLGVDKQLLEAAYYEHSVDRYVACSSRNVRNPDNEPVSATAHPDQKERDRLVRQRRVVPESHADMVHLYGPKPALPAAPESTDQVAA